ncbi:Uncharacterized protein Rs2_09493 [Raphanus sativus]|nr:Uncharacterized protein Rs2_09493 [Raphanus sativus]
MHDLGRTLSYSLSISKQPIRLSSIYYRLFETLENRPVPSYTIPPHEQISKYSPQTPRNKRRRVLGIDTIIDEVSDTPEFDRSCLTSLSNDLQKRSFKAMKSKGCHQSKSSCNTLDEDDGLVGTDLFGGLIDADNEQVFDCSSLENTDTEDEDSDFDDTVDFETEVELNRNRNSNKDSISEPRCEVVMAPNSAKKKYFDENGINSVCYLL